MKIAIKNGHVIDPANALDAVADVFIAEGRIVAVGACEGFTPDQEIDARGKIVCPGLVDLAARLREPGFEYRATLESEMAAAVAGGVTSLACPPDTDPPLDEPGLVEMLKHRARLLNRAKVYPVGALTAGLKGEAITEMAELFEAGCVAFGQANQPIINTEVLMRAMQYAATFGYTVWAPAIDPFLGRAGVAHEGEVATRLGLRGIPVVSETLSLATLLQLARATGAALHVTRLSSAAGLQLIDEARARGVKVTCDVSIQHLHLCEIDIGYFDPHCHLIPPLRTASDREALAQGLAEGRIDALCSDHTPVDDDAKQRPFSEAEAGATGLELLLPLTLKWAQSRGLSLPAALARITVDAARILGVKAGTLSVGAAADVCIFQLGAPWRVTRDRLKSQGKNTPFLGHFLEADVRTTLVDGQVVFAR
jgi:dihydroorotase